IENARQAVDQQTGELEKALHNEVNVPISNLSSDIQAAAARLQSTVVVVDSMVRQQQQMLFTNASVFLAGLETMTLDAKRGVIPWADPASYRLYYLRFDSSPLANIVPKGAGRLTV